jgi:hypothetical protein
MAYTTIDDPSAHFHIQLYTGNGSANNAITNDANAGDFQPDLVWIKNRDAADSYCLFDSTRGATEVIQSDDDSAEATDADTLDSFASDGFQVDADVKVNTDTEAYVAWQWKANGGSTSSNDDGDYTSTVQANTTAGFSIVFYGDATSFSALTPANVGHGLGAVPKMILIKNLDGVRSWGVHHSGLTDASKIIYLEATNAEAAASGFMDSTAPTSSVFTVDTRLEANGNNLEYIAYCFAEVQGYSKFGSYIGNGNADGTFVYTGFKPAWLLLKQSSSSGEHWRLLDSARSTYNTVKQHLAPSIAGTESVETGGDFLSNGFKLRDGDAHQNADGETYIYAAFAEQPFVTSGGVPCTAR